MRSGRFWGMAGWGGRWTSGIADADSSPVLPVTTTFLPPENSLKVDPWFNASCFFTVFSASCAIVLMSFSAPIWCTIVSSWADRAKKLSINGKPRQTFSKCLLGSFFDRSAHRSFLRGRFSFWYRWYPAIGRGVRFGRRHGPVCCSIRPVLWLQTNGRKEDNIYEAWKWARV